MPNSPRGGGVSRKIASDEERQRLLAASPLAGRYEEAVDRPSAYEALRGDSDEAAATPAPHIDPPRLIGKQDQFGVVAFHAEVICGALIAAMRGEQESSDY